MHKIWFNEKPCLAGAGTADYQHIFVSGKGRIFRPARQHKSLGHSENNVVEKIRVHIWGNILFIAPTRAAVFNIFSVFLGVLAFDIYD